MTSARKSAPAAKKAKAARKPTAKPKKPAAKKAPAKPVAKPAKATAPAPATQEDQRPLTEKEKGFVAHYLLELNATQAYIKSHPGVTYETARVEGSRTLANPRIQAAVAEARAKTLGKLELSIERILLEATRLALFDPRKLFAPDGRPLQVNELDDDTAAAIAGLEVLEEYEGSGQDRVLIGHVKKYKVADKNSAIEKLMKHLGAFEKDNRQKGASLADALKAFLGQLHGNAGGRLTPVRREGAPGNVLTPKAKAA